MVNASPQRKQRRPRGWLQQNARLIWVAQRVVDAAISVFVLWGLSLIYRIEFSAPYIILAAITVLIMWPIFKSVGIYYSYRSEHPAAAYPRIALAWTVVFVLLLLIGYVTQTSELFSRLLLCSWLVVTPIALCFHHLELRFLLRRLRATGSNSRKAVIAGTGTLGQHLAQQLRNSPQLGLQFCGFFAEQPLAAGAGLPLKPMIGTLAELPDYAKRHQVDVVYVAMDLQNEAMVSQLINALQDTTVCVYFVPNITAFSLMQARVYDFEGIPLIAVSEMPLITLQVLAKRMTDIVVSAIALLLAGPFMLVIAMVLKGLSPGPVLFKQRRYDLKGGEFGVYKFRTRQWSKTAGVGPQITRVGALLRKTGLESLPKLFNVLQGQLSIVGPRPQLVAQADLYNCKNGYRLGRAAKPGLTGWAQIHDLAGEDTTPETTQQQLAYDLDYLQNWSLWLDLKIMTRTALDRLKRPIFMD